jgi:hypothetical protein
LKAWQREITRKPTKKQLAALQGLAMRVERLWQFALRRYEIAESQVRRQIPLWGREAEPVPVGDRVTREEIEATLADPDGAVQRLRRVMDAWNALWFWPLTNTLTQGENPPSLDQWIAGLEAVLGKHIETSAKLQAKGQTTLDVGNSWVALGDAEATDLGYAGAHSLEEAQTAHPWLLVTAGIARQQGFFPWELEFATVFARGGFDLQVGNPPWVRPRSDVDALLAEGDPWWQLKGKVTQAKEREQRELTLDRPGVLNLVLDGTVDVAVTAAYVGSSADYPFLAGLQPDLYRCFMELVWRHAKSGGTSSLIHYETHFTDERAGGFRAETYLRIRRHWHFVNELRLFEIEDHKHYGVSVFGNRDDSPHFLNAGWLYHPDTVIRSLSHDGSGPEPGLKTPEGAWDQRPHRGRLTRVDDQVLTTWHELLEDAETPVSQARMVYTVNRAAAEVLQKLAHAPRVGAADPEFSRGWDESIDRKKGVFDVSWGSASSWRDAIIQGPHLFVGNPFYKQPNETMLHNQDWSAVDLESLPTDALPITSYKPALANVDYDAAYTHWAKERIPARDHYRVAWRNMAANTGERTLIAAVIPPGTAHIHGIASLGFPSDPAQLSIVAAAMQSLVLDFIVRAVPKSTISGSTISRLPLPAGPLTLPLKLRAARLNSMTEDYAGFWRDAWSDQHSGDSWAGGLHYEGRPSMGDVSSTWSTATPLIRASDRRQALLEIDALVALSFHLSADELCTIYRTQFAVLYGYDKKSYFYDASGRLVPKQVLADWRLKGDHMTQDERTATNASGNAYTYELPFVTLDREADMRQAYAHFERLLQEQS